MKLRKLSDKKRKELERRKKLLLWQGKQLKEFSIFRLAKNEKK